MDILGIPTVLVPPNPGNVSAFGLLTVDVKNDYVQTHVALQDRLDAAELSSVFAGLATQAAAALTKEGFAEADHVFARTADLRYFGQAFEVRVQVPAGDLDDAALEARRGPLPRRAPGALRLRLLRGRLAAGGVGEPARLRHRPDPAAGDPAARAGLVTGASAPSSTSGAGTRQVCFDPDDGYVETPLLWRTDLAAGTVVEGPAIIEEFGSTVPLHPGFIARIDDFANIISRIDEEPGMSRRAPTDFPYGFLTDDKGASADPVLVEIVQGSLASRRDGGRDRDRAAPAAAR